MTTISHFADTSTRLLEAGRRVFARQGYEGASIRAITQEASVNLGAVTYHFGSKEGLYDAVVESVLAPLRDRVTEAASKSGDPLRRIEGVVRAFYRHLSQNPDQASFMLQQVTAGGAPIQPVQQTMRQVTTVLSNLVREGQRDGTIRDSDTLLTVLSIVALPVHLTLAGQLISRSEGLSEAFHRDHAEEQAVQFVRRALAVREEP